MKKENEKENQISEISNNDILKRYNINQRARERKMQFDFNKISNEKRTKTKLVNTKENESEFCKQ